MFSLISKYTDFNIDTAESLFYTVLTSLLMSIIELGVFYMQISQDISKQIKNSIAKIPSDENATRLKNILNNSETNKKKIDVFFNILPHMVPLMENYSLNKNIFTHFHKVIERPYVNTSINLNYFCSILIVSFVASLLYWLLLKIQVKYEKFNYINLYFFILSFVFIAGYQAFFTFNIGLGKDKDGNTVYEYASLPNEMLPIIMTT